jgi:DNA-binding LytR/AlgR family response regulator
VQQIEAFAAHDQSSAYPNNLYEIESRLDAQHFISIYRQYLGLD